jgi:hypothetical protein
MPSSDITYTYDVAPIPATLTPNTHTVSVDMIGKTIIDLEDRWFDARWQKMGEENVRLPGSDPNDPTKV